jgi:two-component system nitrogen regulation response regulator NtrX
LFLDEVGDMSLKTQAKVLRTLDEQRFLPVGASHAVHVDVRVIAATNKDLEEEIARGNFREDLFYRLNVIPFFVPPLRDRKEDIPLLVKEFLEQFGKQYGRPNVEMTEEALAALKQMLVYRGPGKLTESGRVNLRGEEFSSLLEAREAYERDYILKKLDEFHGNVSRAAEGLGLERSHLYRKMKALGVSVKE